jgi:hypothetical protein
MEVSFIGGGNQSTQRKPLTSRKSLICKQNPLFRFNFNFLYNSFRYKKIRALPDFESDEDNSKTASQQTSTPNKKLTDEPDVVSFRLELYFSSIYCT